MLYILYSSPSYCDIDSLLSTTKKNDDLILLGDSVIIGLINSKFLLKFLKYPISIYALEDDIIARGLNQYFSDKIIIIQYNEFVLLTEKHIHQISW
ncbi:sulfurtransferase complex subunit TusB [Candidatus Schneideria nysicola]|uniref:sulfurtransferase complex subunit TusB n=1 Tax=Candidatus Schneideria nysicola TaxID=1081631 RepID=UPI001CAA5428|nr:sulfurtransferase complex subunit TusB [Candidatus Schneideria nysicola]UAJ66083.1 sulfurtransferase complex subunit TusB [Candidatus Schneideria nysicola]